MVPCISCGNKVSTAAKACPICGQPWPKDGVNPTVKILKKIVRIILISLLGLLALVVLHYLGLLGGVVNLIGLILAGMFVAGFFQLIVTGLVALLKSLSPTSNFGQKFEKKLGVKSAIFGILVGIILVYYWVNFLVT